MEGFHSYQRLQGDCGMREARCEGGTNGLWLRDILGLNFWQLTCSPLKKSLRSRTDNQLFQKMHTGWSWWLMLIF